MPDFARAYQQEVGYLPGGYPNFFPMIWPQKNLKFRQFWAIWSSTTSEKTLKSPEATFLNQGLATQVVYLVHDEVPAMPDWDPSGQAKWSVDIWSLWSIIVAFYPFYHTYLRINLLKSEKGLSGSYQGHSLATGATFHFWPHPGILSLDDPTPLKTKAIKNNYGYLSHLRGPWLHHCPFLCLLLQKGNIPACVPPTLWRYKDH